MINLAILDHPLSSYYPLELLVAGKVLPKEALSEAKAYGDALTGLIPEDLYRAPRASLTVFRGLTNSLTTLAQDVLPFIRETFPNYSTLEHEGPAALFLSMELIMRQRNITLRPTGTTETAKDVAGLRGWANVNDVTSSLLTMEERLVSFGVAILRSAPVLQARFQEDDAIRTYDDTVNDIRRRLDYMDDEEFKPYFDLSPRTAKLREEAEKICQDGALFRQGREGRLEESVLMTQRRNLLFTGLMDALTNLQLVLKASLQDDHPDLMAKVDAEYWWNLARLSRKAKKSEVTEEEEAASGGYVQ